MQRRKPGEAYRGFLHRIQTPKRAAAHRYRASLDDAFAPALPVTEDILATLCREKDLRAEMTKLQAELDSADRLNGEIIAERNEARRELDAAKRKNGELHEQIIAIRARQAGPLVEALTRTSIPVERPPALLRQVAKLQAQVRTLESHTVALDQRYTELADIVAPKPWTGPGEPWVAP